MTVQRLALAGNLPYAKLVEENAFTPFIRPINLREAEVCVEWGKEIRKIFVGMVLEEALRAILPACIGYIWFALALLATISFLRNRSSLRRAWGSSWAKRYKLRYILVTAFFLGICLVYSNIIQLLLEKARKNERADLHFVASHIFMDGAILKAGVQFSNLGRQSVKSHAMTFQGIVVGPPDINDSNLMKISNMSPNDLGDAEFAPGQPVQAFTEYRWSVFPFDAPLIYNKQKLIYVVTRTLFADEFGRGSTESCRCFTGIDVRYPDSLSMAEEKLCDQGHNASATYWRTEKGKWWEFWVKLR